MKKSILDVVCESARDLYEAGVMDEVTLEKFEVQQDIEAGLADAKAGRVLSTEEARAHLLSKND